MISPAKAQHRVLNTGLEKPRITERPPFILWAISLMPRKLTTCKKLANKKDAPTLKSVRRQEKGFKS